MAKTRQQHPLVDRFRREWKGASATAYAQAVQRFLRDRRLDGPLGCKTDDLFAYVAELGSEAVQRLAVSAFVAFFGDLTVRGEITVNPSLGLANRVAEHRRSSRLRGELRAAGVPDSDLLLLTGRRILQLALHIDDPPPDGLRAAAGTDAIAQLASRLVEQIGRRGLANADDLLDEVLP